jgi:hypothetical protein
MIRVAFALLIFIFGLVWVAAYIGPDVLRDFQLRNQPLVPATDSRITNARCTNYFFVLFASCNIDVTGPQNRKETLHYAFVGRAPTDGVRLVRPAAGGPVVADMGLQLIWRRVAGLGLLAVPMFFLVGVGLRRMFTA